VIKEAMARLGHASAIDSSWATNMLSPTATPRSLVVHTIWAA